MPQRKIYFTSITNATCVGQNQFGESASSAPNVKMLTCVRSALILVCRRSTLNSRATQIVQNRLILLKSKTSDPFFAKAII